MTRQFLPIAALLFGSFLLLFSGGIHALLLPVLLPVRGGAEGFSAFSLGLLGRDWAIGYVAGCVFMAGVVARVGHICKDRGSRVLDRAAQAPGPDRISSSSRRWRRARSPAASSRPHRLSDIGRR